MKARYTGYEDGPRRVGFAEKSFPKGVFIDVSDVNPKLQSKLALNPFFDVSDKALSAEDIAAADAVNGGPDEPEALSASAAAPADKGAVIAALEALQATHPEVTFNPKASLAKLQQALEDARFQHGDDE